MNYSVKHLLAACALLAASLPAWGAIGNGGFESGWNGWTTASQPGSDGGFHLQTGPLSPVNGIAVPAAPGGTTAAMSDAEAPGSHVLYQDFVQDVAVNSAMLSFDVYVNNRADNFWTPSYLDFDTPDLNQQGRIDLLLADADPFSMAIGEVLLNLHRTTAGMPAESGYTTVTVDVTALLNAHLGETLRFRVAAVDNVSTLLYGVDNVALAVSPVPEPEAVWMLLLALGGMGLTRFRRAGRQAAA